MRAIRNLSQKKSWLLWSAIIGLITTFFLLSIIGHGQEYEGTRNFSDIPLWIMLLFGILIAPVFEEVIFRGFFSSSSRIRPFAFVGLSIFVIISFGNALIYLPLVLFLLFYFLHRSNKNLIIQNLAILMNAILFTSFHYRFEDLFSPDFFYLPLGQFSIGLLLLWVVINYNLKRAIMVHMTWNAILMGIMVVSLQYPNTEINRMEQDDITMEWQRVPLFESSKSNLRFKEKRVEVSNMEVRRLYTFLNFNEPMRAKRVLQSEPYVKYNLVISFKDSLSQDDKEAAAIKMLKTANLIRITDILK